VDHSQALLQTNLEYERERQCVITARLVEELVERTGQHVVLGGDFDAMPETASIRFSRGRQSLDATSVSYRDAWELTHGAEPGHTFAPSVMPLVTPRWRAGGLLFGPLTGGLLAETTSLTALGLDHACWQRCVCPIVPLAGGCSGASMSGCI